MALAALIDAGVAAEAVRDGLTSLGLPIRFETAKVRKGGFAATQVTIVAPEEHTHRHLSDVEEIVIRGSLTPPQRELALRIFRRLAEAEATAHGMPLEKVHFHEVGALDSIADIVGVAIALDLLGAKRITSRSVPTGSGMVKCAHGLMPIPAPGTAALLRGVPLAPSTIKAELTTPTGAAILTTVVQEWIEQPVLTIERIGHGAGQRDFLEQPNLLRVFVGEVIPPTPTLPHQGGGLLTPSPHQGGGLLTPSPHQGGGLLPPSPHQGGGLLTPSPHQGGGLLTPSPLVGEGWGGGGEYDRVWVLETNLDDVPAE